MLFKCGEPMILFLCLFCSLSRCMFPFLPKATEIVGSHESKPFQWRKLVAEVDHVWGKLNLHFGTPSKRGSPLCNILGAEDIGLFLLVDSYWGYLISHWLAILLIMVGFSTKPNAETVVCHWIMIWCWLFLTNIDVMYIVQDRWGLLADENRESLGAVNCVILDQELL